MLRIISFVLLVSLAGCATTKGISRAMEYPQKVNQVAMPDDTYRVFEHATDKTLMTTTSLGKALGAGTVQGITLGLVPAATPEQLHQAAAQQYLINTGRENCTITSGYLLAQPQYEFTYQCPEPVTAADPADEKDTQI